jgi:hypothetical protein
MNKCDEDVLLDQVGSYEHTVIKNSYIPLHIYTEVPVSQGTQSIVLYAAVALDWSKNQMSQLTMKDAT